MNELGHVSSVTAQVQPLPVVLVLFVDEPVLEVFNAMADQAPISRTERQLGEDPSRPGAPRIDASMARARDPRGCRASH